MVNMYQVEIWKDRVKAIEIDNEVLEMERSRIHRDRANLNREEERVRTARNRNEQELAELRQNIHTALSGQTPDREPVHGWGW